MALQTKKLTASGSRGFSLELTLTENNVNTTNNTSSVTYKMVLKSGGYYFSDYSHGYKITLGGKVVAQLEQEAYQNQISISANSSLTIASGSTSIPHNPDGTLNMSVSFSFYTGYTDTISGSGTMALTRINRGLVKIGNKTGQVYIGKDGEWKPGMMHVGVDGEWKLGV